MSAFLLKPCKGSHGYQGITDHSLKLDLPKLRDHLLDQGFSEKLCVDIIMVMQRELVEYTIYPSGKFLIKPAVVQDEDIPLETAEELANGLLRHFTEYLK